MSDVSFTGFKIQVCRAVYFWRLLGRSQVPQPQQREAPTLSGSQPSTTPLWPSPPPPDSTSKGPYRDVTRLMVAQMVKNLPAMQDMRVQSLGREDPLEKGMATHSSVLAFRSPWTEGPGGLQSLGSRTLTLRK